MAHLHQIHAQNQQLMHHPDRRGSGEALGGSGSGPLGPGNGPTEEERAEEAAAALRVCQDVQHMIDINSEHLERLRTPMATHTSGRIDYYEIPSPRDC